MLLQHVTKLGRRAVDDGDARVRDPSTQVRCEICIDLEHKQLGRRLHAPDNLSRKNTCARPKLCEHPASFYAGSVKHRVDKRG